MDTPTTPVPKTAEEPKTNPESAEFLEEVLEVGGGTVRGSRYAVHCLTIVGQIVTIGTAGDVCESVKPAYLLP